MTFVCCGMKLEHVGLIVWVTVDPAFPRVLCDACVINPLHRGYIARCTQSRGACKPYCLDHASQIDT